MVMAVAWQQSSSSRAAQPSVVTALLTTFVQQTRLSCTFLVSASFCWHVSVKINLPAVKEEIGGHLHGQKMLMEPFIREFQKFNSNSGVADVTAIVAQALSHYPYLASRTKRNSACAICREDNWMAPAHVTAIVAQALSHYSYYASRMNRAHVQFAGRMLSIA